MRRASRLIGMICIVGGGLAAAAHTDDEPRHNQLTFGNPAGVQRTITTAESFDLDNPFFQDLGTNGRTCFTCHRPDQGWTVTPDRIRERFERPRAATRSSAPTTDRTAKAPTSPRLGKRRAAFSLLLNKGLIRVGIDMPDGAEFVIDDVDDPYNCGAPTTEASMYPPAAAVDQPRLPEHGDVGRPRDRQGPGDPRRPRDPGERRDHGPRAGRSARVVAGEGRSSTSNSACSRRRRTIEVPAACAARGALGGPGRSRRSRSASASTTR